MADVQADKRVFGDRFETVREVGRGGMAVVYLANDTVLRRPVALKVLYPSLAIRPDNIKRFQREALVVSKLTHPNIVQVYDYSGGDSGENYIVSEFVEGVTLRELLEGRTRLFPEVAAMIIDQVAGALGHAHRNDIIHRDVKPENVMVGHGRVKLTDFGIAHMMDFEGMTVTGTMVGSPSFMSPEQIEGHSIDRRSDIFSLGSLFYVLCTGELPFKGTTAHALFRSILDARYVPAQETCPAVGQGLSDIIDRCLRRDPSERFATCEELQVAIRRYLASMGIPEEPADELKKGLADLDAYESELTDRLVFRLLAQARELRSSGLRGQALRLLDRAAALDPADNSVIAELGSVQRDLGRRRAVALLGVVLLLLLVIALGSWFGANLLDKTDYGVTSALTMNSEPDIVVPAGVDVSAQDVVAVDSLATRDVLGHKSLADSNDADEGHLSGARDAVGTSAASLASKLRTGGSLKAYRDRVQDRVKGHAQKQFLGNLTRLPSLSVPKPAGLRGLPAETVRQRAVALGRDVSAKGLNRRQVPPGDERNLVKNLGESSGTLTGPVAEQGSGVQDPGKTSEGGGGSQSAEAAEAQHVTIEVYPPAVEVFVNGTLKGQGKVEGLALKPGVYTLKLHHPKCDQCQDQESTFEVVKGVPTVVKGRIGFKPAHLIVSSSAGGQVFVNGKLVGRVGERIEFQAKSPKPWSVTVKTLLDNGKVSEQTVILQAGYELRIDPMSTGPKAPKP